MSQEFPDTPVNPSHAVAMAIANNCPQALFCGFRVKAKPDGTFAKLPVSKTGVGVGADIDHALLVNADELRTLTDPPNNSAYWGIFMQNRQTFDPFGDLVLTILDLDTKRSTAPRDLRMVKLMEQAKERGLLTERSHSKKGGHIIFLANPDPSLPVQINLGNHQEIEIFGHPKSAGKNVMLTGDSIKGELIDLGCTVKEFLESAGIHIEKQEEKKPSNPIDFSLILSKPKGAPSDYDKAIDALHYINPDADYDTWLDMGFALQKEFGDQAKQDWMSWSMARSKPTSPSDLEKHWKSFGKKDGVGIGTLFHTAKQAGWEPPTKVSERRTAVDEFKSLLTPASAGSPDEPATKDEQQLGWPERQLSIGTIRPIRYMIKGFWAHSFSVIAGQPGIGKTTAILSLSMAMAGIQIRDTELTTAKPRKTLIVTEDSDQVERTLTGYARHYGINPEQIAQWFVVIDAKRSNVKDLLTLAHNVIKHTVNDIRPLLVFDTANATMDIENENDNSEVGAFIAALKQTIYIQLDTPVCIITHTNKQISKSDSDATARGASAFTGDATLTGVLFEDESKTRYMRLVKTRYQPNFREIKFDAEVFTDTAVDENGDLQTQAVLLVTPSQSSEEQRQKAQETRQTEKRQQQILDAADAACNYVQSVINIHGPSIIRKGPGRPNIPNELKGHHKLEWPDIYQNVPQADQSYARKQVGAAIFQRFSDPRQHAEIVSGWVLLS